MERPIRFGLPDEEFIEVCTQTFVGNEVIYGVESIPLDEFRNRFENWCVFACRWYGDSEIYPPTELITYYVMWEGRDGYRFSETIRAFKKIIYRRLQGMIGTIAIFKVIGTGVKVHGVTHHKVSKINAFDFKLAYYGKVFRNGLVCARDADDPYAPE